MPVSSFDLLPPFQEETNFVLATNQGCESTRTHKVQSTIVPDSKEWNKILKNFPLRLRCMH